MKPLLIVTLALCAGLVALADGAVALAQSDLVVVDDKSGANGTCTASGPPSDHVVFCSDMRPGKGRAVTDSGTGAKDIAPAPEPAPDAAPAPESTDTAVASPTDQDADNIADDQEPGLGLDPTNPDTDGDNVADGDEITIYGTDPLNPDTDGDGASDGEELFWTHTDPLVWDDFNSQGGASTGETP